MWYHEVHGGIETTHTSPARIRQQADIGVWGKGDWVGGLGGGTNARSLTCHSHALLVWKLTNRPLS